ncbi:TadA family conjugal transfer-associated ATPase [Leifsonia naganoensis]|uniref:Pilus assembly protein CpaF n=1 Tax=Leifsonia naganoensis TaxID=150025 RepID=A0A853DTB9_9MICO|nr:TadA family conjugal transfer-associated ATPase [Leifsonia naganoensis]NYK08875.1 pilus assembly protein CpaF [Leifsonia naganoensis]
MFTESRRPPPAEPGLWETFGVLTPYLLRPGITDLFIAATGELWSDGGPGGLERIGDWQADEPEVRRLAVQLIARGGRHIDEATPFVDVRLRGGVRVHAVLPPVSTGGTLLSIRIPSPEVLTLPDLVAAGSLSPPQRAVLDRAVAARTNLLVTGAGGAGKTTLLAAVLAHAPPSERIVVIEDVAELRIPHPHVVGLQARQPNLEGAGGVDLRRLVREALRMRPDRLVLGECRGEEIRDLLAALNTGHDGGAGTLHANSLLDVPARLEALGALAGLSEHALARQAVSAIGLVVHVERSGTSRRVAGFARLAVGADGRLGVRALTVAEDDAPAGSGG